MHRDDLSGFNEFANGGKPSVVSKGSAADPRLEKYRAEIAGLGLSEEQETEILQILGSMMWHFARLGWSVDVCGLFFEEGDQLSDAESAGGRLNHSSEKEMPSTHDGKEAP